MGASGLFHRRTLRVLIVCAALTLLRLAYVKQQSFGPLRGVLKSGSALIEQGSCTPEEWSAGNWTRRVPPRTNKTRPTSVADVLEFEGFEGCTSDREHTWHFAGDESQWHRFPEVTAYEWIPGAGCHARQFDPEAMVRDLVEKGGWLLVGDSVSENHFFSLSCLLYPHVRTTPNFTEIGYYEHHWPQNMYLSPTSPLVQELHFPEGFDIATTPLVTFRRSDLLVTKDQLAAMYRRLEPERASRESFRLFSGNLIIETPPLEYLTLFTAPLPEANYGTLVVSTAGHWTDGNFEGIRDTSMPFDGFDNVLTFFGHAMTTWAGVAQSWLKNAATHEMAEHGGGAVTMGGRRRQVIARAYLPGHDRCHDYQHPWERYEQANMELPWNWRWIGQFNEIFKGVLSTPFFDDVHFLDIYRPGLLRPDTHVPTDCLHLMAGSGVMEGWTRYIWHYITREITEIV